MGQRLGQLQVTGRRRSYLLLPQRPQPLESWPLGCQGTSVPTATCHRKDSLAREKLQFLRSNSTHQETR